ELSTGLNYGARTGTGLASGTPYDNSRQRNFNQRFSVSYVTGSHAIKAGLAQTEYANKGNPYWLNSITYQFRNQLPVSLIEWASPQDDVRVLSQSLFVQDQWTVKKLTLNLGARYDHFTGHTLAGTVPERRFAPGFSYDAIEGVPKFNDI